MISVIQYKCSILIFYFFMSHLFTAFIQAKSWIYATITKDPGESAVILELPAAAVRVSCAEREQRPGKCIENTSVWSFNYAELP